MTVQRTRCFIACLVTETNSFSPLVADKALFESGFVYYGDSTQHAPRIFTDVLHEWSRLAREEDIDVVESLAAFAQPAGPVERKTYEEFRDRITGDLEATGPVAMVLLMLHGAMCADGYSDCEGDLLRRIRSITGPQVPVGVVLDPHCNLTEAMCANASAIVVSKLYPHTDFVLRGKELFYIALEACRGRIAPTIHHVRVPMIGVFPTAGAPMQTLLARMDEIERYPGVLSASLIHGFPWSDNPDMGAGALVVTDGTNECGAALAGSLAEAFFEIREYGRGKFLDLDDVIAAARTHTDGTLVIADAADNPGGGCPGDATFLLKAFLDAGIENTAFYMIFDPACVEAARQAGTGATVPLTLGGRHGALSGPRLEIDAEVLAVSDDARQRGLSDNIWEPLGSAVCLRVSGNYVIVNSLRQQAFSPEPLQQLGVDATRLRVIVVKSTHHFEKGFASIASRVIHCSAPGCLSLDFAKLPYRHIRRPVWPLDLIGQIAVESAKGSPPPGSDHEDH